MQGLAGLLFPAVLMLFALAMEKVQERLDRLSVGATHVDEFLESADATDVDNLAKDGLPAALDELRNRRNKPMAAESVGAGLGDPDQTRAS